MTWIVLLLICFPLTSIWSVLRADVLARRWRKAAFWLFFPVSAVVAVLGIAGNGELRDVECTLLIAGLGLLAFVFRADSPVWRRTVVALMCGLAISALYLGSARLRVYTIDPHTFFEWKDNDHVFQSGFLKDLRASQPMIDVDQQVTWAVREDQGPVFFGPRLDFEYAVQQRPSPAHWVSFYQPGTSFDRAQTSDLAQIWIQHRFKTLVFLKDEYSFYPRQILDEIDTKYQRDDHNAYISVYHRRPGF